jgi:predicted DNA-binding transcriptional regulator AlpA
MPPTHTAPAPTATGRRCIDADQVAAKYRMSRRQVFRAADAGLIPPGFRVGRLRRWDEAALDQHIADGARPVRSPKGAAR